MLEMFKQLVSVETEEEALEAEKFFLDKTKESADVDFKANVLDVTAELDEYE